MADRTAVLAVGVVAGFAIGLSFNAAGREQVAGWFLPEGRPAPLHRRAQTSAIQASVPEPGGQVDPRVLRRVAADGRLRIGVFGDSFGNGLWDALYHQLPPDQRYDVLRFSKEATGFTRYHALDLEQRAREQVGRQPIDVAVICFGANDLQPIYEGRLQPLLSDGWKRIVGARIDRFVAVVRSTGATLFWVGLPVMRDAVVDEQIQEMDAFYADRMRALKVPFVDMRPASLDADGHYNAHLTDAASGRPLLMRTPDGMHMTGMGYQRLTAGLARRVRDYAALARRQAGLPVAAKAAKANDKPRLHAAVADTMATPPHPRRAIEPARQEPKADAGREARQTARANRREGDRVRRMETKDDLPANGAEPAGSGK